MGRHAQLSRFAKAQLKRLPRLCPVVERLNLNDDMSCIAFYSEKEWKIESPSKDLSKRFDWMHWFACDVVTNTSVEIFFERLQHQVAVVWLKLRIDGRLLLLKERLYRDQSDGCVYSAGGVRLECAAPLRLLRLVINTMMEEPAKDRGERKVHVRFGARAAALGHTFEVPKECPASFLAHRFQDADSMSKAKEEIFRSCAECQAIIQPYTLYAEVFLDGKRQEMALFGSRLKCIGTSDLLKNVRQVVGYAENGTGFLVFKSTSTNAYGYIFDPSYFTRSIREAFFSSGDELDGLASPVELLAIKSGKKIRKFTLKSVEATSIAASNESTNKLDWDLQRIEGQLVESSGTGIIKWLGTSFVPRTQLNVADDKIHLAKLLRYSDEVAEQRILSTVDTECKNANVTGGKAASLAVLSSISRHLQSFLVPTAVVLTVNYFNEFAAIAEIRRTIENFVHEANEAEMQQLKLASENCVAKISQVSLTEKLQSALVTKLRESFGDHWQLKKFAVRSSAIGEDSEETSVAGQMTTYLAIKGRNELLRAIVKCWASQFSLTAVNYKRQYGQQLNGQMAVIVQEMVNAESAGVMFTCDPVSSNPSVISIAANFGLGESVVSSIADPDTFTIFRDGKKLTMLSKTCGKKEFITIESMSTIGTETLTVESSLSERYCLTDNQVQTIATIGASLSDLMDSPCDLEWAIKDKVVYLLQSRPVTSFFRETDFEIRHDIDSSFYTSREIFTRANVDEIMPGALSPLSISTTCHLLFGFLCKQELSKSGLFATNASQYSTAQSFCCGKKNFTNISQNGVARSKAYIEISKIGTMGYDISKHEALEKGIVHESVTSFSFKSLKYIYDASTNAKMKVAFSQKYADEVKIELPENGNSLDLLMATINHLPKLYQCFDPLFLASMFSSIYNVITLKLLKKSQNEDETTPEIMSLLSKVLRSEYEVESALIPKQLSELSALLREDPHSNEFVDMDPDTALRWLEKNEGPAGVLFQHIRTKNAHRCYKEFDLYSKTWDLDPMPMIVTLQTNVQHGEKATADVVANDSITVDQLPIRPGFIQRKLLNCFISRAQYFVYAREATKSALMKCFHQLRLAMRKVGSQLYLEGRIPDPELVFFFTCDEIYRLILTRDPSLLPRAIRRFKMHPILDKERFPVLFCGMPHPLDSQSIEINPNVRSMNGLSVSQGVAVGPARIVHDFLTEAHLIQKGDILITRATDTGWTPYFPLLGGLVTEVGGLLSHGSVVAREYGLPAVVGICGVTDFLNNGDIVIVDGNKGLVSKSEKDSA